MPPINPQGSRTTLLTAMVAFVILFVTAAIFAIYFNAQLRAKEMDYENLKKSYNGVVSETAFTTPEVTSLQAMRNDPASGFTTNNSVIDIALQQRDALAQDITGAPPEVGGTDAANKAATDAITTATAKLKAVGVVVPAKGLVGAVSTLVDAVVASENQIKDLSTQVTAAKQQVADATRAADAATAARDKQIADIRAASQADQQKVADQLNENNGIIAQLQKDATDSASKSQAAAQTAQSQLVERDRMVAKSGDLIRALQGKLRNHRPDVTNATVRQPDGRIVRVPNRDLCYINLGQGDQISPGLTFEVYDKSEGVPALPNSDAGEEQLPVGKASIEVTRVGATSSECRVVRTSSGAVLSEGDVIENLVYDPNTKYNFFVFGDYDLADTGRPNAADGEVIKRLVSQWGGKLTDQVNVDTDFVVLGKEPEVPVYSKEEMDQPLIADKVAKAQASLNRYSEIRQTAIDLHIPILNQNRFLYYVGYYDLAKR